MGHSIAVFKGARARRNERRDSRRERRDQVKNGPTKQYYGGSEDELKAQRDKSQASVDKSQEKYDKASSELSDVGARAGSLERTADADYSRAKVAQGQSRTAQGNAIGNITTTAAQAAAMRDKALADNNLNKIAEQNILSNQQNAGQTLGFNSGLLRRGALGTASGMGESGALGMQTALATSGQGAADLAAQSAMQQNQLAAATRMAAGNQQVQNALGVADSNANGLTSAAGQVATQQGVLRAGDQAQQVAAAQRDQALLGQQAGTATAGAGAALDNQGQMLNNQQVINGAQLGVDMTAAQNKYNAAKNGGFVGFLKRFTDGTNAVGNSGAGVSSAVTGNMGGMFG